MCKKLIHLIALALVLGLFLSSVAHAIHPKPVAWWKFDGDALDSSGNGHHGTLMGSPAPIFVPGVFDQALDTTESNGPGYVEITGFKGILGGNPFSITAWINTSDSSGTFMGWGSTAGGTTRFEFRPDADELRAESSGNVQGLTTLPNNEWIHIAVTVKANAVISEPDVTLYLNGQVDNDPSTGGGNPLEMEAGYDVTIARRHTSGRWFDALIDDVRLYDVELTQKEVQDAMAGVGPTPPGLARGPSPENEATDVPREVVLNWTPGAYAPTVNGHTVYMSKSFNDVNDGVGGITQSGTSYTPAPRLDFATTYYWRIDEVNAPPDSTVHRGEIWSFTTEPVSYPIDVNSISATASSVNQADLGPEKTIDGSGLDVNDLHSTEAMDMWLSGSEPSGAWIQYELDKVYKLHEMWIWNSNQPTEAFIGFGFKEVTVEYSIDGAEWMTLDGVPEFARAPGTSGYAHDTTVDFGGAAAKYVKLTATSNWGGVIPQYGLSEVRFFYIPIIAREPSPDIGITGVDVSTSLSWRAGREAAMHNVYLSTDAQAVTDGNAPVNTVAGTSYSPDLDLAGTYYWRVDEVNEAETPTTWQGDVWDFTTQQFIVVDDFEDYNDYPPYEIYSTWLDGYENPANGSQVGYLTPPLAETTIVQDGAQSMPLIYSNTGGATYSEATRTFAIPQNWTQYSIQTLGLLFHGAAGNTGQLYVKINGVKVSYDGDAGNVAVSAWQPWNIDLATVGVNLQSVTSLTIGIDGNAAAGTLYVDGIRLYAYARQLVTPVQPDPTGLAAHWQFDGNLNDSSGNGHHGTAMGDPTFAPGKIGQAISLDGVDDYVTIPGYKGIVADRSDPDPNNGIQRPFTVACWINTTGDGSLVCWGSSDGTPLGGQYQNLRVHDGRLRAEHGDGRFRGAALVNDGQWHHVALTVAEGVNIWPPGTQLYVDGQKDTQGADTVNAQNIWNITADADVGIGVRASHGDRFFTGMFDDVRIYERVLTHEEIAGLAGRTDTFDSRLDLVQD